MNMTTRLTVASDGTISTDKPLPRGEYIADVRSEDRIVPPSRPFRIEDWPKLDLGAPKPDATFSREEIYGDDMR